MFKPLAYDSGKILALPVAATQTIAKGDALIWASGYLVDNATTTTEEVYGVAMQDSVLAAEGTLILVLPVDGVRFEADCDGVVSIVDRGQDRRCDLATLATLNPDSMTEKVFLIDEIVGTPEVSKVVRGFFSRLKAAT